MSDEEIIDLYWNRDDTAIAATASKYGPALASMARRMILWEDAEECLNDTYLSAWNHIPPTRPQYFFAWLAKVCRNFIFSRIAREQAAKRKAELVALEEELVQYLPNLTTEAAVDGRELGRLISAFLRTLPRERRIIFLRRYWYGDSIREIAAFQSCTESKVKTSLHRTRTQLKDYLEREEVHI